MKRLISFIIYVSAFIAVQAQWSVGVDARLAPWGGDQKNMGTDVVLNYKFDFNKFYIMPTAGFFYQKYTESRDVIMYYGSRAKYSSSSGRKYDFGYRTGFDVAVVIGKSFNLGAGSLAIFTGPRYAYAFATKPDESAMNDHLRNSLDWRVGTSYSIWRITASAKCDIGMLRYLKQETSGDYDDRQVPVLAIGLAYNF